MQERLKQFAKGFHLYHVSLTMIFRDNRHYVFHGKKKSDFAKLENRELKYEFKGYKNHCFIHYFLLKKKGWKVIGSHESDPNCCPRPFLGVT